MKNEIDGTCAPNECCCEIGAIDFKNAAIVLSNIAYYDGVSEFSTDHVRLGLCNAVDLGKIKKYIKDEIKSELSKDGMCTSSDEYWFESRAHRQLYLLLLAEFHS